MPTAEHTKLSAIKHRCRARRTARKRARPAFLCSRSDPCVCVCVCKFFFSFRYSVAGERAHDAERATLRGYRGKRCNMQAISRWTAHTHTQTVSKPYWQIKIPFIYDFSFYKFIETFIYNRHATLIYSEYKTVIVLTYVIPLYFVIILINEREHCDR